MLALQLVDLWWLLGVAGRFVFGVFGGAQLVMIGPKGARTLKSIDELRGGRSDSNGLLANLIFAHDDHLNAPVRTVGRPATSNPSPR